MDRCETSCSPLRKALPLVLALAALVLLATACQRVPRPTPSPTPPAVGTSSSTPPPGDTPTPQAVPPRVEVVATGLEAPWELAFAPDGRIFLTERPGRLRVIEGGRLRPEPLLELDVAETAEAGLLGLALDPAFAENGFLYLYYTYADDRGRLRNRVSRFRERDGAVGEEQVLLEDIPGAGIHDGGRIAFGPDGRLYVTTGDATAPALAQDRGSLAGKVLRLNADGTVPQDNPFPGSPVYSYGHRNPQGLAWHPDSGELYATEHGPAAHDEVNRIRPGENYGWPEVHGIARDPRFVDPVAESGNTTWAPSGATFSTSDAFPQWRGSLLFAGLRGEALFRLEVTPGGEVVAGPEWLLFREFGRLRTVVQAPDGTLYLLTSNRSRGQPDPQDDRVLRLVPQG